MDFVESGKLVLGSVKFFVLDEADRLLDTGNQDTIMKLYSRFPKAGKGVARLQVDLSTSCEPCHAQLRTSRKTHSAFRSNRNAKTGLLISKVSGLIAKKRFVGVCAAHPNTCSYVEPDRNP